MCAIAGLIACAEKCICGNEIYKMADMMFHRGPDAQGFAVCRDSGIEALPKGKEPSAFDAVLGFDRLSIRDTSSKGMQPMISPDGNVAIVFNGEIYNTNELKKNTGNYIYRSSSDTEVILAYYLENGIDECVRALNGILMVGENNG